MQILLTGATGFLGQAIAVALKDQGHAVRAIVRSESRELARLGIEQQHGQITAFDQVCAAATGCDAIVHAAGCSDPLASIEQLHDANVRSTDCMLGACELLGIPRLLLTSCANVVIGAGDLENADERQTYPAQWISPYPHTKALAEQRVLAANSTRLATCVIRPHLLWGAGESRLLPALLDLARRGKLRLFGEPDRKIDPCHIDNAAHAHALALARLEPGSAIAGKSYFIGQGEPMTIENFLNALLRAGGFPPEKRRLNAITARALATAAKAGADTASPLINPYLLDLFSRASWFNLAAAKRDLGYAPKLSTAEGMSRLFTALTRVRMQSRTP
ncbi:MAG: NAD-dependent epimerase/dehydratase family protein [Dokdonella sp.]|uniref:NAD-dependent epimerase/dehydratase family protein n=1 Tax=Dokdonella sp. TaxID=2291710 RepID=UPI002C7359CD|nr:NAD-dependent epimerase/dehydratase family protein [Dokdonella sp.]HOX71652.1 NAD-dependent epimerase/dehydratase family protein [Dokdonella sp.]HPG93147.1 NAD-dependent epimerase/dehydratase family protein [Dokdonella sp.]HPN78222.1 NAD-dependent epimerase/dehydratase family protein [Dokdonella sp.]